MNMERSLTYPQWFALLALKHFSPERPDRILRYQTFRSLAARGLAIKNPDGSYSITERGIAVENFHDRAPAENAK